MIRKKIYFNQKYDTLISDGFFRDGCCLDIVILSMNGLFLNRGLVNSFLKNTKQQDRKSIKIMWVDNGSSDGTLRYLQNKIGNENSCILDCRKNTGVCVGRNLGIQTLQHSGRSKYTLFMDNDQQFKQGWFDFYMKNIQKFDIIGSQAWVSDRAYSPLQKCQQGSHVFSYLATGGCMVRSQVFDKIKFDQRFNPIFFQDQDFCFSAWFCGFKMMYLKNAPIVHYGCQTISLVNKKQRQDQYDLSLKLMRQKWNNKKLPKQIIVS